ncbi:VCBS repeat-containing protein [Mycolicibacterium rutilum]|uniref:VCBS repeat-containing protein n=1 Tax=Mycolicibacterium rutilum TaxID=370526 RepID=A0A1H6LLG1_MYCRU|nr:Ig-like domain-containing protein [Mycolicibacterium rutilum]SEH87143.1 VCBS repeat-containing protein [Mycolicibacterium rutilum]
MLTNDTDVDGGPKTVTTITQPTAGGTAAITNAGNTIQFTPTPGYTGTTNFTYTLNGGSTATVTVTVNAGPPNTAPVANADNGTVAEGGTVIVDVIDNDTDTDGTIDPATVVIGTTVNGTATANPDGTVSFTHNGTETTTASFTYTVKDNNGATSNSTTVTLAVTPVDDAPTAVNDSATTTAGAPVTVNVLTNDTDVDGGPKTVTTITQPTAGGTAAITNAGNTIQFTPTPGYTGTTNFTYTLNGGSTATVTVTVNAAPPTNTPPTVDPTFGDPAPATGLVIGNLNAVDDLKDADELTYSVISGPTGLVVNDDGSFTYTPTTIERIRAALSDETETVSFTVSVSDGVNDPVSVTVTDVEVGGGMYVNTKTVNTPGGLPPFDMVFAGDRLFAANPGNAGILVYNTKTGLLENPIPTGGAPVGMYVSNNTLYVTVQGGDSATEFDLTTGAQGQAWPAGDTPGLAAEKDGVLYVVNQGTNTVTLIDVLAPPAAELNQIELPGRGAGLTLVGDQLYVTSFGGESSANGFLTIIDTTTGQAGDPIDVGVRPGAVVAANGKVYVVNTGDSSISVLEDGVVVDTIVTDIDAAAAPLYSVTAGPDGTTLVIGTLGLLGSPDATYPVLIIDTATDEVVHTVLDGPRLFWIEYAPDGTLYASGVDENSAAALFLFELLSPDITL